MRELRSRIEISAPTQTVWDILTSFSAYPQWNPFIPEISGEIAEGSRLNIHLTPPGGRPMRFKPTVTRVIPGRELRWLGHLFFRGLFDGEHIFEIVQTNETTVEFTQRETFGGLLVPFLWRNLNTNVRQGFHEMNAALKKEAESR